jgi:methyl-accepting chemotaxis protein
MNESNQSNEKISETIHAIDPVAFQSNLLALNAAVSAGEDRMGFATAANEVRILASLGSQTVRDVASTTGESL